MKNFNCDNPRENELIDIFSQEELPINNDLPVVDIAKPTIPLEPDYADEFTIELPDGEEAAISMEIDEDVDESFESIKLLMAKYNQLMSVGVISRSDVMSIEGIEVGIIPNADRLNRFSQQPSVVGYNSSMEGLGGAILKKIVAALKWIVDRLVGGFKYIYEFFSKSDISNAEKKWDDILKDATRIDGIGGVNILKNKYPNHPRAKSSLTVSEFITHVANDMLSGAGKHWCVGMGETHSGKLPKETEVTLNYIDSGLKIVKENVGKLQVGTYNLTPYPYRTSNIEREIVTLNKRVMEIRKPNVVSFDHLVRNGYSGINNLIDKVNAINNNVESVRGYVDKLCRDIDNSNLQNKEVTVQEINRQVNDIVNHMRLINVSLSVYGRYTNFINAVLNKLKLIIVSFAV